MFLGIGLFGVLAASLASYFIEQDKDGRAENQLTEILLRLGRIEQDLHDIEERDRKGEFDTSQRGGS